MKSDLIAEYTSKLPQFEKVRTTSFGIIQNILTDLGVDHLPVQSRVKSVESASAKFAEKGYKNPLNDATDLVGLRVIVYLESDIEGVSARIREAFSIDDANSSNRLVSAHANQFGYRSLHLICSLGHDRERFVEYRGLCGIKFEVQIRTVLQHAWAEIEHKRNYKGEYSLPKALKRRLLLAAAQIEQLDSEFSKIAAEAEQYAVQVRNVEPSRQNDEITAIALNEIFEKILLDSGIDPQRHARSSDVGIEAVIAELKDFGVETIGDLASWIASTGFTRAIKLFAGERHKLNAIGFFRILMISKNAKKFFSEAFRIEGAHFEMSDVEMFQELSGRDDLLDLILTAGHEVK